MIQWILYSSLALWIFTMMATVYRLAKGPTSIERVQSLDIMTINMIAGVGIFSVFLSSRAFFEVILLLGILSFIGTIAYARFLESGVVIERKRPD